MQTFIFYQTDKTTLPAITEWTGSWEADDQIVISIFKSKIEVSIVNDIQAVHFKMFFAEELDRKPTSYDAGSFYCPYVPLMVYKAQI